MIKKLTFILSLLICSSSIAQVKLWNNKLKKIKTKGTFFTIEGNKKVSLNGNNKIFGISAVSTAGVIIPYAISYGNSALKALTSKNEADYNSENLTLNNLILNYDDFNKKGTIIKTVLNYYPKKSIKSKLASEYKFLLKEEKNSLIISISDISENFIPVKSKKSYDYILQTFDFNIKAHISTKTKNKLNREEIIDLGTTKITRQISSFTKGIYEKANSGAILIPKLDKAGEEINIKSLIISCNLKYLNPYGMNQSSINKFLENNSDTNESLLNTIFIKPSEEGE